MLVANVTLNQTFRRKVTHPFKKRRPLRYSDYTAKRIEPAIKLNYQK